MFSDSRLSIIFHAHDSDFVEIINFIPALYIVHAVLAGDETAESDQLKFVSRTREHCGQWLKDSFQQLSMTPLQHFPPWIGCSSQSGEVETIS